VHLGALTALALTLTGCNQVGDDDDCDSRSSTRTGSLATAAPVPTVRARFNQPGPEPTAAVPSRGGFGTHLASCGG
jgi:hypothetical protein